MLDVAWARLKPHLLVLLVLAGLIGTVDFAGRTVELLRPRPEPAELQIRATPPCAETPDACPPPRLQTETAERREQLALERRQTQLTSIGAIPALAAVIGAAWAAAAAIQALRLSQQTLRLQQTETRHAMRAYLQIEAVAAAADADGPAYRLTLRNTGRTPASWFGLRLARSDADAEPPSLDDEARWFTPLGPDGVRTVVCRLEGAAPERLRVFLRFGDMFDAEQEFDAVFIPSTAASSGTETGASLTLDPAPDVIGRQNWEY